MPIDNAWSRSFASPSPSSSDEDDSDTGSRPAKPITSISRDAQLARDLDISSRDDRAVFKETPFTMAKMKAGKKDTRAGKGDADLSKGRGNVLPATADGSIPLPAEKPEKGKRGNGGQAAEQERAAPSRPAHWNTGWYNHQNKPILIEPAPKRSLIDEVDKPSQTGPSKEKGKKAQKKAPAKGRKGAKGDEGDRPVFRRIPANASPTAQFPIVQGIEKQKSLPLKSKKANKKKMTTRALSITPDSADQPIPDLDIDALVGGAGSGTEKLAPKEVDSSNQNLEKVSAISEDSGEIERSRPRNKLLTQGRITITKPAKLSRHFSPPAMTSIFHHTDSKVAPPAVEASSQLPSLHRSGPTAETDNIDTPLRSGRAHSGPSTITYVSAYDSQPDPAMAPSSSSRLPYSSPLLTKDKRTPQPLEVQSNHLFGPRATNANIVDRLETLAWHETPRISPEGFEEESRKRQEIASLHGEKILERLTQPPKKTSRQNVSSQRTTLPGSATIPTMSGDPPNKRARSPEELDYLRKQNRHENAQRHPDNDLYNHPAMRSPSPGWSTLPTKRPRPEISSWQQSSPKLADRFRMPLTLFTPKGPQPPGPPPVPRFTKTTTLFTPSRPVQQAPDCNNKPMYDVYTGKGSKYGPLVGARQHDESQVTRNAFAGDFDDGPADEYGNLTRAAQAHRASYQVPQEQEPEDDWTQAWKKPSNLASKNIQSSSFDALKNFKFGKAAGMGDAGISRGNGQASAF